MARVLLAWVGWADLAGPSKEATGDAGPIAQALKVRNFDRVVLLESFSKREDQDRLPPYISWLKARTKAEVVERPEELDGPTDWGGIYKAALRACQAQEKDATLTFHLSPGTPPMGAVWVLLGKTVCSAELIESSREHGVRTVTVPFDIAADFLPDLLREADERLRNLSTADSPSTPEFKDIIHRSDVMTRLIQRARRAALRNVPVLIEGASGTGKELFAKAIHQASPRHGEPFVAVNCGAIPATLVESRLFGHERGSFTGADRLHKGLFEQAHGGTLFLDELGELPLEVQVKLLRVVGTKDSKITRVGGTSEIDVDVRVISATNRTVLEEVQAGRFREDLFYRLAVAVLKIPPLRERPGDVGLLVDALLRSENVDAAKVEPGYVHKKLSVAARKLLLAHPWPGNVRELQLTLRRALIWSDGPTISADDVRESLLPVPHAQRRETLNRPLGGGFNLQQVLKEVARHYLARAVDEAGGEKKRAAELVGAPSPQTLSNWLKKYELDV
jgi:transcriptional regulator with PAS, ATPase and Fis domain